jgi:hypothetical protein
LRNPRSTSIWLSATVQGTACAGIGGCSWTVQAVFTPR